MKTVAKTQFGDFQTPVPLATEICVLLKRLGVEADTIIEPTCGIGHLLASAADSFPAATLHGFELNPEYLQLSRALVPRAVLREMDFFTHDWDTELLSANGRVLILGNPPWVTSAAVAVVGGANLPVKNNSTGLRGLAARTGKANFDISEWMLLRLLGAMKRRRAILAVLCKTATARKVLRHAWSGRALLSEAKLFQIDAAAHFSASVDACLFFARLGEAGPTEAEIFPSLAATMPSGRIGLAGRDLASDLEAYRPVAHLEGFFPLQWRSGVKHDCASVMELRRDEEGCFHNKLGEVTALEHERMFPLLKCTDLAHGRTVPRLHLLVTQHEIGADTSPLAHTAPLAWAYLQAHAENFAARKSSLYRGRAPFSLFGVGTYTFAPWKVAVSGLHHAIRFTVVPPHEDRPVLFDDTCYFLPFDDEASAHAMAAILNSKLCRTFLHALIFSGAKRPVTVDLLQRINLDAVATETGLSSAWRNAQTEAASNPSDTPQLELAI